MRQEHGLTAKMCENTIRCWMDLAAINDQTCPQMLTALDGTFMDGSIYSIGRFKQGYL